MKIWHNSFIRQTKVNNYFRVLNSFQLSSQFAKIFANHFLPSKTFRQQFPSPSAIRQSLKKEQNNKLRNFHDALPLRFLTGSDTKNVNLNCPAQQYHYFAYSIIAHLSRATHHTKICGTSQLTKLQRKDCSFHGDCTFHPIRKKYHI